MPERVVALLPLRGGSKSIPDKNIRPLGGKPLCAWALEAAARTPEISQVFISTDSPRIAEVVTSLGLGVKVVMRPDELATDTATTESVMLHFARQQPFDVLCLLQATSPLTTSDDLSRAIAQFDGEGLDSLATGVRVKRFFWTPAGQPLNYDPARRPMRQQFAGTIMENGAFYLTRRAVLEQQQCRLGGKIGIYEMPEDTAVELDEPADWLEIEAILARRRGANVERTACNLRLMLVDVDGTLTDGGMYYSERGEELKRFDTRDARGMRLLKESGVEVVLVTAEDTPIVSARARKLGLRCLLGVSDKTAALETLCRERDARREHVAFVGDDLNDAACMRQVGFAACPADAQDEIKRLCAYQSPLTGGHGAVRDICNHLLKLRGVDTTLVS